MSRLESTLKGRDAEREACLLFSLIQAKVGRSLTSRLGGRSFSEAAGLSNIELAALAGLSEKASYAMKSIRENFDIARIRYELARHDAGFITLADEEYPQGLRDASDPPPALYVKGTLPEEFGEAVAVVGSRKASVGAHSVARSIGGALAARGVTVVSGLALGIDAEVHRGSLGADGPTIGVLGCGIDIVYPKKNHTLFDEVIESGRGAIVSEYYLGEAPLAWRFPARNRIIAGLAGVTVVVEAAERSGSLITARHALDEGREVWAVPGPLGMAECRGSNKLLSDGAAVLWDVDEFASAFGEAVKTSSEKPGTEKPGTERAGVEPAVPEGLPPSEARALTAVDFVPSAIDAIGARSGLDMRSLLPALTLLELKGYVVKDSSGAFVRKAGAR